MRVLDILVRGHGHLGALHPINVSSSRIVTEDSTGLTFSYRPFEESGSDCRNALLAGSFLYMLASDWFAVDFTQLYVAHTVASKQSTHIGCIYNAFNSAPVGNLKA